MRIAPPAVNHRSVAASLFWSSWDRLKCLFPVYHTTTTTTILSPFFRDLPDEPVPAENFWTLWCKGRLTEADTDHPAGRHSIRTNQCPPLLSPPFLQAGRPSSRPTNSVKALKATLITLYWEESERDVIIVCGTYQRCT